MKSLRILLSSFALSLLAACGGGGSGGGSGSVAATPGIISGTATKGPLNGATVTAYGISNGQPGARIASVTTDANGNFSLNMGGYAGPVQLQVSGGSYTDEATGLVTTLASGDAMTAAMPAFAAGATIGGIQVTPLTAMAQALAQHLAGGLNDANIAAANAALGNYFAVADILHDPVMNPLLAGAGTGASQDAQNYGMALGALSQYARTQGMTSSAAMVTALINDAADGVLDGKLGGAAVPMGGMIGGPALPAAAGTTGLGAAMNVFVNSAQNRSGVAATSLMSKLNGATGQLLATGSAAVDTTVSGTVFNGPTSKATLTAFAINDGVLGAQLASVATDGQGNFVVPLGSYSGPLLLQVHDATYTDEASGATVTMAASDVMSAVLSTAASGTNIAGIWVTPITSMAQSRALAMSGGLSNANIAAANAAMGNYYSVGDILHTAPMNPLAAGAAAGASQDARNYGLILAAMSQYANTLQLPVSSELITALMNDAADGVMNGRQGSGQIFMTMIGMMGSGTLASTAGSGSLATAMTTFMNSAANVSGLSAADMAALLQQLNVTSGNI